MAPTIMDYARQNYIAQPGDGLEGEAFIRQIGPYDHYAVNWGAPDVSRSDIRPLLRTQLRRLATEAESAGRSSQDAVARAHLEDVADRVARILDPEG